MEVINDLKDKFDSHDFIKKFSKRIELDYVYLLATAGTTDPFRTVNMQIGNYLSNNQERLGIELIISDGKHRSENVFGNETECGLWRKVGN